MLEIRNLHHSYDTREVLKGVNATIEEGGFYAVMGANGCGKTTLLRCCANLLTPTAGAVVIAGRPATDYSAKQLARHLAMVSQQATADLEFTAFETVMMARNPYQRPLQAESRKDRDIVEQAMRQTGTWHLRDALPSEMSGGERQRVMLARALAQQTPLMLLDEPLANLDIAHQYEIMELLCDINRRDGKTLLLVVHDLQLAYRYCPRLLLLHEGSVFFQGDTRQGLTPENIRIVFDVDATVEGDELTTHRKAKR